MTIVIVDQAVYLDGERRPCHDVGAELDRLRDGSQRGGFVWVGIKDPTPDEFADISERLRLHPLSVEDTLGGAQRPKIDVYDESMFVVLKTLRYLDATSDVETGVLTMFVGDGFVLTVRTGEANPLAGVRQRLEAHPQLLRHGPVAVMHAVIDHIVDAYVAIDAELAADLDEMEEKVFSGGRADHGSEIYRLKREVLEFKRAAVPLAMPIRRLVADDGRGAVPDDLRPFFSDVLDHLLQVSEHAEGYDRLLSDILAAHVSQVGLQQNDDMRKISAWVAIAAVPTMIAGIYGMNFPFMPEFEWRYSYFVILGVMVASCGTLYKLFRRSGWL